MSFNKLIQRLMIFLFAFVLPLIVWQIMETYHTYKMVYTAGFDNRPGQVPLMLARVQKLGNMDDLNTKSVNGGIDDNNNTSDSDGEDGHVLYNARERYVKEITRDYRADSSDGPYKRVKSNQSVIKQDVMVRMPNDNVMLKRIKHVSTNMAVVSSEPDASVQRFVQFKRIEQTTVVVPPDVTLDEDAADSYLMNKHTRVQRTITYYGRRNHYADEPNDAPVDLSTKRRDT